jgi:hypothetical protein
LRSTLLPSAKVKERFLVGLMPNLRKVAAGITE